MLMPSLRLPSWRIVQGNDDFMRLSYVLLLTAMGTASHTCEPIDSALNNGRSTGPSTGTNPVVKVNEGTNTRSCRLSSLLKFGRARFCRAASVVGTATVTTGAVLSRNIVLQQAVSNWIQCASQ
jgi:hypothetical protein